MQKTDRRRWLAMIVVVGLPLAACSAPEPQTGSGEQPAQIERTQGSEVGRVTLTEKAIQRIDLRMTEVREMEVDGTVRTFVPYSSIIYDSNGHTWVYTSPGPRTFVREAVSVDRINGDWALLGEGPTVGTSNLRADFRLRERAGSRSTTGRPTNTSG